MAGLKALISLDGTKLSEHAFQLLPLLKTMGFDSVRLVSVWESAWEESESGRKEEAFGEATEKGRAFLEAYLDEQATAARSAGFAAETVVRIGRAADEVVEAAQGVDLVLIATHGRSGISRWWLGSVADKVLREVACPVLIIGPNVQQDLAPAKIGRILLPLDGSDQAEEAIPVASWLAALTNSEIEVVRSMSLTPVAYDASMSIYSADLIGSLEESVQEYLALAKSKLPGRKVTTTMLVGGAAELITEHLQQHPAGLIVMTSHGRSGVRRAALGSVTDRLLHGPAPVLVVRGGGKLLSQAKSAS
jgi:nucleotide-binding universal stress UspA family protein